MLVYDMAVAALNKPAEAVDSAALLINIEALLGLQKLWNSAASALIVLELKVAHEVVRVEVEFFNAERSRYFTLVIDIIRAEHLLLSVVLEDVAGGGVLEVTANVSLLASLVNVVALTILEHNNVATLIAVQLTQDVIDVEGAVVGVGRHLYGMSWLVKVLDQVLRHHNLSLEGLLFLLLLFLLGF